MKLLLVEDDQVTYDYICKGLEAGGHCLDVAQDGVDGLALAHRTAYDVIILDRMLPGIDGLALLRGLRASAVTTPIIFLTAISGVDARVEGIEAGADDYLIKPFAFSELNARIHALARRPALREDNSSLQVADLHVNLITREVTRAGQVLDLLPKEFALLEYFMRSEGRVLSKTMLLERVWGFYFDTQTSVVETHISRLRAKIDKPFERALLHTIKNVGYALRAA